MTNWSSQELEKLGSADEVRIAPRLSDGSFRSSVPIWIVSVDDALYVRSYHGKNGSWYRSASKNREGRVAVDGLEKEVLFEEVDPTLNDRIDLAFRTKYSHLPTYVGPMLADKAREATLRVVSK